MAVSSFLFVALEQTFHGLQKQGMVLLDTLRPDSVSFCWQIDWTTDNNVQILRERYAEGKSKPASKEDGEESDRPGNLVHEAAFWDPVQVRPVGVKAKGRDDGRTSRQRLLDEALAFLQIQDQFLGIVGVHQSDLLHAAGAEHEALLPVELPPEGLAIDRSTAGPGVNLPQEGDAEHGARHEAFAPARESGDTFQVVVEAEDGEGQDVVRFEGVDGRPAQFREGRQLVGILHDRLEGEVGLGAFEQGVADFVSQSTRELAR